MQRIEVRRRVVDGSFIFTRIFIVPSITRRITQKSIEQRGSPTKAPCSYPRRPVVPGRVDLWVWRVDLAGSQLSRPRDPKPGHARSRPRLIPESVERRFPALRKCAAVFSKVYPVELLTFTHFHFHRFHHFFHQRWCPGLGTQVGALFMNQIYPLRGSEIY